VNGKAREWAGGKREWYISVCLAVGKGDAVSVCKVAFNEVCVQCAALSPYDRAVSGERR
jgi:hypothetical protein